MENRKITYNNMQYNILTSIKLGSTAFLICLDVLDKKIEYFKQEVVDGKVKLTSREKLLLTATEVNQKSLSNKKRVLESFIAKLEQNLAKSLFVDHNKVINEFKKLTMEVDSCDLKYYMIENASIEPTDESIEKVMEKFNAMDINKDLDQIKEIKNELYYFNANEEEVVKPKEEGVSNANKLETNQSNEDSYNGPKMAINPFEGVSLDSISDSLNQTKDIEAVLTNNLKEQMPEEEVNAAPKKRKLKPISYVFIVLIIGILAFFGYSYFIDPSNKTYTTEEIMKKVNAKVSVKEIDDGVSYNEYDNEDALESKLIDVNIASLKSLNANTVGWIKNDYLSINYPLVKGSSNSFYASHDYLKGNSTYGWLHVDSANKLDEIDRNTVIYGSADLNSEFFYSLKNVFQADFIKDVNNQIIKLSTDNINSSWLVFSIYEIANEDYHLKTEFKDDEEFADYLDVISKRSVHDFEISLDENDKILTLSTNKDKDTRIVVHAKLIKTDKELKKDNKEEEIENEKGAATKEEEQIEYEKGAATKEEEIKDGN